jgi:hypothetical protein
MNPTRVAQATLKLQVTYVKSKGEIIVLCEKNLAASLKDRTLDEPSLLGEGAFNRKMIAYIENHLADGSYLTCEDFHHAGRQCCKVCHDEYPDEMCIARLPDGRMTWICCAIRRAIYHEPAEDPDLFEKMLGGANLGIEEGLER